MSFLSRALAGRRIAPDGVRRVRGQSLAEFALVAPILLLAFAAAADLGRGFYAYVAIENAAKEGAMFGSRAPLCDDAAAFGCADPNNVRWRVQAELREQGVRDLSGNELVPTIQCVAAAGGARGDLRTCTEGDTYSVSLTYTYRPLTPIIGSIVGDLDLSSTAHAVVLNLSFDPTPGVSIQKYVSPIGATNGSEVISKCLEPDDTDANGFYRSPCLDSSTPDATDTIKLRFEQGTPIAYRLRVANSGEIVLNAVTLEDSQGSTGCAIPATLAIGFVQECSYTRQAPDVTGSATSEDYINVATMDSVQTTAATSDVTVTVEKPPARLRVMKWVSPFELGDDGDGLPTFGSNDDLSITYSAEVREPFAWFKVVVLNTGGQPATGLEVIDSRGSLPVDDDCPQAPDDLDAGAGWVCRYRVTFSSASPSTNENTVSATGANVAPDGDDSHTATVRVSACTGGDRTVPNVIGMTRSVAESAWTDAGFTGALVWNAGAGPVSSQGRMAFECVPDASGMTVA